MYRNFHTFPFLSGYTASTVELLTAYHVSSWAAYNEHTWSQSKRIFISQNTQNTNVLILMTDTRPWKGGRVRKSSKCTRGKRGRDRWIIRQSKHIMENSIQYSVRYGSTDTICIDKPILLDLDETILSMNKWYDSSRVVVLDPSTSLQL
jgi:hypothetical protein